MKRLIPDHADVPAVHRAAPPASPTRSRRDFIRSAFQQTTTRIPVPPDAPVDLDQEAKGGTFIGQRYAYATVAPPPAWGDSRARLLRRATNGLKPSEIADIEAMGYQQWLTQQLNYTRIDDSAVTSAVAARFPLLSLPPAQMVTANAGEVQRQLQESTIFRAAFSRRQLYERMVEFWSDHFNIYMPKVGNLKAIDDREVIRRHALGRFSDLLSASAHSAAMLAYLDQNQSRAGSPNQNYVRELMELHTLGVDGGYTQQDVDELARVFTGWSITNTGDFTFIPNRHDYTQKIVLGVTIPASSPSSGTAAQGEGEQMLAFLVNHPSTSRFIARKLLQWFITPEPSTTQVEAVAGVFRATRGDIKLVVRAVLNSGWVSTSPAKLKRPFHLVVSAFRGVTPVMDPTAPNVTSMNSQINVNGHALFQYETPDGYPDLTEYWSGNLVPRWNFANTVAGLTANGLDVTTYLAGTPDAAVDKIQHEFFGDELSAATRSALLTYLNAGTFNAARVRETVALAISSAEFQWF